MGVIPKKTTPLTKFVRTGEGVLVFGFNLAMLIIPIVSSALTPEQAVKWAGIVNGVAVICRTGLKIVAQVSQATGIQPQPIGNVSGQAVAVDTASSASNDGPSEVVTGPAEPVVVAGPTDPVVVTSPTDPVVVTGPTDQTGVSGSAGDLSDSEEFASVPTVDDDAVETPAAPVVTASVDDDAVVVPSDPVTAPAPLEAAAAESPDSQVSDEEEFSSVPPADDDDSVDVSALNGDQAGGISEGAEPALVAVPVDPVITDGGGGHIS